MVDAVARPLTLGELLPLIKESEIEIINEIEESLIQVTMRFKYVCPLTKTLSKELLARPIKATYSDGGVFVVVVAGEEDAE